MRSTRKLAGIFHGIDVNPAIAEGAVVFPFDQSSAISQTCFRDGLCWGFAASLMRRLYAGDYAAAQLYTNYTSPLPEPILEDAIELTHKAVQLYKAKRDQDVDRITFSGKRPKKVAVSVAEMSDYLGHTKGATFTYKTKRSDMHTLLFFKGSSGKSDGDCVIQDSDRFTIDRLTPPRAGQLLTDIVKRSEPPEVILAFDPFRRSNL